MSWIPDFKPREPLDKAVYSAIGPTKGNLHSLPGLPAALLKMIVDYLEEYPCFGEREWTTYCGRVDPAPLLPFGFSDIWNGPCPIHPGKKIRETHMLTYIPATLDGHPFTLNRLSKITKRYFPKNLVGFSYMCLGYGVECNSFHTNPCKGICVELRNKSIEPCWVLMTKDVLPGSKRKSYANQQQIITNLAATSLGYEIPGILEAATCILTKYFKSRTRLFNYMPLTYTRCKENVKSIQTIVGGFSEKGLFVSNERALFGENPPIGAAALRRF